MFQGFFKSVKNKSLLGLSLLGLSTLAFAEGHSAQILQSSEFVGITFWLISMALVAATAIVIAVAGPVTDGAIDLTNSPWQVSESELSTLGLSPVKLINDFEALAWGAPIVPEDQLESLGGPVDGDPHCTVAVLGPGTGFGVSALVRDAAGKEMAMPSEGGHACFPPGDPVEDEILRILRRRYDRVSIERLICGPGLLNMHRALAEIDGRESHIEDPAEITETALKDMNSPCGATLARFCAILGAVAGDIALTTGARGGVYIAGGIVPRILPFIKASPFFCFTIKVN